MKQTILIAFCFFLMSGVAAQSKKISTVTTTAKAVTPSHECYMMKDGALLHCMGDKSEMQYETVQLSDGTTITSKGEVTMPNGEMSKMANGDCMGLDGIIGNCEKMHASLKKDEMH